MEYLEGDLVVHWTFGLGKVVRVERRNASGEDLLYYAVQIGDMTIWVPADEKLKHRLRPPTTEGDFKKLYKILSSRGEPLPDDRHQRKLMLMDLLRDGSAESLCRVIRGLASYQKVHPLNENDQALLKRLQKALIGEWSAALTVSPQQAETELQRMLGSAPAGD